MYTRIVLQVLPGDCVTILLQQGHLILHLFVFYFKAMLSIASDDAESNLFWILQN
jgi:hypothetical protein